MAGRLKLKVSHDVAVKPLAGALEASEGLCWGPGVCSQAPPVGVPVCPSPWVAPQAAS